MNMISTQKRARLARLCHGACGYQRASKALPQPPRQAVAHSLAHCGWDARDSAEQGEDRVRSVVCAQEGEGGALTGTPPSPRGRSCKGGRAWTNARTPCLVCLGEGSARAAA